MLFIVYLLPVSLKAGCQGVFILHLFERTTTFSFKFLLEWDGFIFHVSMAQFWDSFSANPSNYYGEQPNENTADLHQQHIHGELQHRKSYNSDWKRAGPLGVFSSLR